jgi:hypothetical protein
LRASAQMVEPSRTRSLDDCATIFPSLSTSFTNVPMTRLLVGHRQIHIPLNLGAPSSTAQCVGIGGDNTISPALARSASPRTRDCSHLSRTAPPPAATACAQGSLPEPQFPGSLAPCHLH